MLVTTNGKLIENYWLKLSVITDYNCQVLLQLTNKFLLQPNNLYLNQIYGILFKQ